MIHEMYSTTDLASIARLRRRDFQTRSVNKKLVDDEVAAGWTIDREGKSSVRLRRPKTHGTWLEDRVWSLLFQMRFDYMSGKGGAKLPLELRSPAGPTNQIDVLGIETDVAIAIECKSQEQWQKRTSFPSELAKLADMRDRLTRAVNNSDQFPSDHRRHLALAFFTRNIDLTANDRERAKQSQVLLFDEQDLDYYEKLVAHLGPAAKYQFFADLMPGRGITGLEIKVPCVKSKIGKTVCYSFPVSPEYLLKISYVSHRTKGKRSDVSTYQRMLTKNRLNKIRQYISDDGVFPTNIVVNIDSKYLNFQKIKQETNADERKDSGVLGWLEVKPAYKSAWVIDGQHRLYAYSGHARASTSHLSVVAFQGLSPSRQAQLFIDINAKQKSVKQSLLQELFAELHWDSDKPSIRVQAIVSKAVQAMDRDQSSPLYGRIQTADATKDATRCISLTSLFNAIERNEFFIVRETRGEVIEYGPLWATENERTLERATTVINSWLSEIRNGCAAWWNLGAAEGGGLAMNDGITACINVLKSVFAHLSMGPNSNLLRLDNEDLVSLLKPYAAALGQHLGALSPELRKGFRDLRGSAGQLTRTRRLQIALRDAFPSFSPAGLDEFIEREKHKTNLQAKQIIDRIERRLKILVVEELKNEFDSNENAWWIFGVPKKVRVDVTRREQEDNASRGSREAYFDLIDYRTIALENWAVFEPLLAFDTSGNKEKRTRWMVTVNEKRNIVAHASSGVTLTLEEVAELQGYENTLVEKTTGDVADTSNVDPDGE
jgi:DNA sulfur modification protein DndB